MYVKFANLLGRRMPARTLFVESSRAMPLEGALSACRCARLRGASAFPELGRQCTMSLLAQCILRPICTQALRPEVDIET